MISIIKATEKDYHAIVAIGKAAVGEAHRGSCSAEDPDAISEKKL